MLTVPGPYAAWASWLDAFAAGADLPSRHLTPVDEHLGPQMQERLLRRVAAAFEARARIWGDTLRRHLSAGVVREPAELGALLVAARGRLRPLRALAADTRLPPEVRTNLRDALEELLRSAQDNLEHSVRRRPHGAERLLAIVRENSLLAGPPPPRAPVDPPPVGRRVIL